MGYTKCLTIGMMKKFCLFDTISYKYIKDIINNNDDCIDVEIEDIECDIIAYCKVEIKFEIDLGDSILKVGLEKQYSNCGYFALMMLELEEDEDEEGVDYILSDADTVVGENEEE